jgi:nucleoid-associated protein YgaU
MSATFITPRTSIASHVHLPARVAAVAPTPAIYRRRRVGAAVFAVALVVSVGSVAQRGLADRGGDPAFAAAVGRTTSYVVQPGDTLWAIAQQLYAGEDIALVVDAMVTLNGGATIQPGQLLNLP